MIKILFICHGNICRSPLAQSVMTYLVKERNLSDRFQIGSAATSREEIGNPPHPGTVRKLREEGIPLIPHRAVQMTRADYETYDYQCYIVPRGNCLRLMRGYARFPAKRPSLA